MKRMELDSHRDAVKKVRFPMNLQTFAEGGDGADAGDNGDGDTGTKDDSGTTPDDKTPTAEELMTQLAQERAEKEKLKNAMNKASSEAAEYKKQLKSKMTAEEQEREAKKEQDEAKDQKIQELESKFRLMDYSKRYMGIGMDEKTAESLAEMTGELPDEDKFFTALGKYVQAATKKSGEDAVQNLLKDRPDINAGNGDGNSKPLAVTKAEELAANRKKGVNAEGLKNFM